MAMQRVGEQHEACAVKAQTGWLYDRFVPLGYEVASL
eukprot:COSAG05_NODE_507_length_9159_cov_53.489183_1_plen_37_part_00